MHRFTDTDTLQYFIVTVTFKVIPSQWSLCQMKDYIYNYMSKKPFKQYGYFPLNIIMSSHVTKMHLMNPKMLTCSTHKCRKFCGLSQKSPTLKWLRYGQSYKFHD